MKIFLLNLINPVTAAPAIKVSLVVQSNLLIIDHGVDLDYGQMTSQRWISSLLSYLVPDLVNVHERSAPKQNG